jgi:hypothetical protein
MHRMVRFPFVAAGLILCGSATWADVARALSGRGAEVELRAGGGGIEYEEDISLSPVDSDWEAAYAKIGASLVVAHHSGYALRLDGDFWASDSDRESWRENGELLQKNDLEVSGLDLAGYFGVGLERPSEYELHGWIGLGFRHQAFERDNFVLANEGLRESVGTVDEDYSIASVNLRLDGEWWLSPSWKVGGAATVWLAYYNEAENELFGTIEGDGGVALELEAALVYALNDRQEIGLAVRLDAQDLEGDQIQSVARTSEGLILQALEWPDNELRRIGIDLFWKTIL